MPIDAQIAARKAHWTRFLDDPSAGHLCCAHARHQWEGFKRIPGLRLLNLVQPVELLKETYRAFAFLPQMHSWCGKGDPMTWPAAYPTGSRVVIQVTAATRDEALRLSEGLHAVCGRRDNLNS